MQTLSELLHPNTEAEFFNTRTKGYIDENGEYHFLQKMTAEKQIFNPKKLQLNTPNRTNVRFDEKYIEALTEWQTENMTSALADRLNEQTKENWLRSVRRAKGKVFDYAVAEYDFKYFITLTLSGDKFPRSDVKTAIEKLNNYLRNRVQRNGLKYIIVPEYHHDGKSIHFHGLINDIDVIESGTVLRPNGGKPVKEATAKRQGYNLADCRKVYNIPSWNYGFTTAIPLTGDREKISNYISKYITKNVEADGDGFRKIGGRFYYSSSNLRKPIYNYTNEDFETASGEAFDTPACSIKISYTEEV